MSDLAQHPDPTAITAELERVLGGPFFKKKDRARQVLRFLVEETLDGGEVNEKIVAAEVYEIRGFRPVEKNVVRMAKRDLQGYLEEYYGGEGRNNPVVISLNEGSYVPVFEFRMPERTLAEPAVTVTPEALSITTAQALAVTVAVSGGTGSPTVSGSVTLTSGSYESAAATLSGGSVTINIPGNTLAAGSYTPKASYTPDASSSEGYSCASGMASSTVAVSAEAGDWWPPNLVVGLILASILTACFLWFECGRHSVSITSLTDGTEVHMNEIVAGKKHDTNHFLCDCKDYLVVVPNETQDCWVQGQLGDGPDWTLGVKFGEWNTDPGKRFTVFLLSTKKELAVGESECSKLYDGADQSPPIKVIRAKTP